jgi:Domain of unknown function (DUF5134)
MIPAWLLDGFAALMLVTAAVSATRLAVAPWARRSHGADNDIAHLLTGIAMAGMLAASVTTLSSGAWEATFSVLTAWFAWRLARDTRVNGIRSMASGHSAMHVLHCGAMVYLFVALRASAGMQMPGMGSGVAQSVEYPVLAVAFSAASACFSAWDLGQLSRQRHIPLASEVRLAPRGLLLSPAAAATCRIAMGVTMAFMLLIMI